MKKSVFGLTIILYLFFGQVYPYVHLHVHNHGEHSALSLSIHPSQLAQESFTHTGHEIEAAKHTHTENHLKYDLTHTLTGKKVLFIPVIQVIPLIIADESHTRFGMDTLPDIPQKRPRDYLRQAIPDRAPPFSS